MSALPLRVVRKYLRPFILWRDKRRLYAAVPELRDVHRKIEDARRRHQPTAGLLHRQAELLHARVRAEIGRR